METDDLPPLIRTNIERNFALFPGWRVILDDDNTCKQKITEVNIIEKTAMEKWYNDEKIGGKFKSGLCRLAQLYLDGGVYLDNDLELISSLGGILERDVDIVTSLDRNGAEIFQAILGASKGHRLIRHSLELFRDHLEGKKTIEGYNIGPKEVYNITGKIDRNRLLNESIYLFKEAGLPESHPMMKDRFPRLACQFVLEGIVEDGERKRNGVQPVRPIYGFSRVKKYGTEDVPCRTATANLTAEVTRY
ncbi:hypothetical protein ACHAWF_012530 [Thalassiosira exigua]